MGFTLPEHLHCTSLYIGAANAVSCDNISLKNAHMCWICFMHTGASDTDLVLTLNEATDVAGGTSSAITTACPIWVDGDAGTSSNTLVRGTDTYAYTINTGDNPIQLGFWQIDPCIFSDGYDVLKITDSGGNASNTISILAFTDPRQKLDPPLSNIVD